MDEDISTTHNLEIHKNENFLTVSVNPRLYSLEAIYSAAYVFIKRAYVILEEKSKEEILVHLTPKTTMDLEMLGKEFDNELLNYMVYIQKTNKSEGIREAIIQRALSTNLQTSQPITNIQTPVLEDPEKIAKPWKLKD